MNIKYISIIFLLLFPMKANCQLTVLQVGDYQVKMNLEDWKISTKIDTFYTEKIKIYNLTDTILCPDTIYNEIVTLFTQQDTIILIGGKDLLWTFPEKVFGEYINKRKPKRDVSFTLYTENSYFYSKEVKKKILGHYVRAYHTDDNCYALAIPKSKNKGYISYWISNRMLSSCLSILCKNTSKKAKEVALKMIDNVAFKGNVKNKSARIINLKREDCDTGSLIHAPILDKHKGDSVLEVHIRERKSKYVIKERIKNIHFEVDGSFVFDVELIYNCGGTAFFNPDIVLERDSLKIEYEVIYQGEMYYNMSFIKNEMGEREIATYQGNLGNVNSCICQFCTTFYIKGKDIMPNKEYEILISKIKDGD